MQCIAGGAIGIGLGFLVALALRTYSPFPASVQTSVAILGIVLSSSVGLFLEFIQHCVLRILIQSLR